MTALQPPPPSPTHSVNPITRRLVRPPYTPRTGRQIPHTGDVQTGATAFYLVPRTGHIYRRGSQPCGKCRDGYQRVCRRNGNNQYVLPHQPVSSHSCLTTSYTSAPTHHPRLPQPRQRGLRLLSQRFRRSHTHPHPFTSCAHPRLSFPCHYGSDRTAPK